MTNRHSHKVTLISPTCLTLVFGLEAAAQARPGIARIRPDLLGEVITCHVGGYGEVLKRCYLALHKNTEAYPR